MTDRTDTPRANAGERVSVIVPVYNAEGFLRRSVESVLGQTHANLELLLVDDGSTDGSERICREYARADARIRVVLQTNSGPSAARNTGLRHAAGEYVLFLDADDYIEPRALELLVAAYREHRPDLVVCNFSKQVSETEVVRQRVAFTPEDEAFEGDLKLLSPPELAAFVRHFLKHPSNHLISYCWARLYKRSIITERNISSPEGMRLFEDFVLNLDYISHADKVVFLNQPLYVYVMHDTHVSASMAIIDSERLLRDMAIFRERARAFLRQKGAGAVGEAAIAREIGHTLIHYLIIFMVRTCRQLTPDNRDRIFREIEAMVRAPIIQESLPCYAPSRGNSRILPLLMKLKLVGVILAVCRYKAHRRYGRAR